jgi:hypothetical protein
MSKDPAIKKLVDFYGTFTAAQPGVCFLLLQPVHVILSAMVYLLVSTRRLLFITIQGINFGLSYLRRSEPTSGPLQTTIKAPAQASTPIRDYLPPVFQRVTAKKLIAAILAEDTAQVRYMARWISNTQLEKKDEVSVHCNGVARIQSVTACGTLFALGTLVPVYLTLTISTTAVFRRARRHSSTRRTVGICLW